MRNPFLPKRLSICAILIFYTVFSGHLHAQEMLGTNAAYAAGYKAAFTCSAVFNGGKTLAQISAHELFGIYTEYQSLLDSLVEADIDYDRKRVSVAYGQSLPPRISVWRPHLGCVQLPPGADTDVISRLPAIDIKKPRGDNNAPWQRIAPINGSSGNEALDQVIKSAFRGGDFNPDFGENAFTSAILIATPKEIIAEHYLDGYTPQTSQRTWSVAKSIAATVIGTAVKQGLIDVKKPAPIPAWQNPVDPRQQITVENLLHMSSGLDSNRAGNRTDRLYLGGGSLVDTAVPNSLEQAPNSRWKYANYDTLLAMRSLREAINDDDAYLKFPFQQLLYKIGMLDTYLETDWNGDFIMSSQVWTTSRDLARLGILYLNNGSWNGERILPENWASYVATPAPMQPAAGATGYGAQFWLYNERSPNIPNDTYAAHGNRGQYLMIIPSRNLLIVRRGYDPTGGRGFQMGKFAEAVLQAIEK